MFFTFKNYEFEAKVYVDLAAIADGTGLYFAPVFTDNNSIFRTRYEAWINNIQNNLQERFTDRNGFNSLCSLWFTSFASPNKLLLHADYAEIILHPSEWMQLFDYRFFMAE